MSDCRNPSCKEKDLHPVTVRSYDGCCSQLCEEIMDHEQTCEILERTDKELAVTKALASKLLAAIEEHKNNHGHHIYEADDKLWEVLK